MLVLTADIGEGHDLPARIIKADLEEEVPGAEVEIENGLEAMGKISAIGRCATAPKSPSAGCPGCSTSSTG